MFDALVYLAHRSRSLHHSQVRQHLRWPQLHWLRSQLRRTQLALDGRSHWNWHSRQGWCHCCLANLRQRKFILISHIRRLDDSLKILQLVRPGYVSFVGTVNAETYYDRFFFRIDEETRALLNNNVNRQSFNFSLSAGPHVLQWRYAKDDSLSYGDDKATIWDITIEGTTFAAESCIPLSEDTCTCIGNTTCDSTSYRTSCLINVNATCINITMQLALPTIITGNTLLALTARPARFGWRTLAANALTACLLLGPVLWLTAKTLLAPSVLKRTLAATCKHQWHFVIDTCLTIGYSITCNTCQPGYRALPGSGVRR